MERIKAYFYIKSNFGNFRGQSFPFMTETVYRLQHFLHLLSALNIVIWESFVNTVQYTRKFDKDFFSGRRFCIFLSSSYYFHVNAEIIDVEEPKTLPHLPQPFPDKSLNFVT